MRFKKRVTAANDNAPLPKQALRKADLQDPIAQETAQIVRQHLSHANNAAAIKTDYQSLRPGHMMWQPGTELRLSPETIQKDSVIQKKQLSSTSRAQTLAIAAFFACLVGLFGVLASSASPNFIALVAALGSISAIASLMLPSINWRLREILGASLLTFMGIIGLMTTGLDLPSLAIPFASFGLVIAYFSRTRLPAILGILSLLVLAYIATPIHIEPVQLNVLQGSLMTALIFGFMGVAERLTSKSVMSLALLGFYIWGAIWILNSGLSIRAIAAFIVMAMAAQYKLGKSGLDNQTFGSISFVICGWIIGMTAFFCLQWGFLSVDANAIMIDGNPAGTSIPWLIGCGCALTCIIVAGMSRLSKNRQSLMSLGVTTFTLGLIPLLVLQPDFINTALSALPHFQSIPHIGLIMAAFGLIITSAMIINGLRLNKMIYISLGLTALGAQTVLLLQPSLLSFENAVMFTSATLLFSAIAWLTLRLKA